MDIITSVVFGVINKNLITPYELSFATVTGIDSLWICVIYQSGRTGIAEAVPLPGYGSETIESVFKFVKKTAPRLIGSTRKAVLRELMPYHLKNAFSISAIATAMEFPDWIEKVAQIEPIALVYPLSTSQTGDALVAQIEAGLTQGYRHFKMKIGKCLETDMFSARYVLDCYNRPDLSFRFDANQAYCYDEALEFCQAIAPLSSDNLLWIEQPLVQDAWDETRRLCNATAVPIMLDESIYDEHDIERAKKVGCAAVKLKLFKHCGISDCIRLAKAAKQNELLATIGNGVSSDIGNLHEALVVNAVPDVFVAGSECNGFLKIEQTIAFEQLKLRDGFLTWDSEIEVSLDTVVELLKKQSKKVCNES